MFNPNMDIDRKIEELQRLKNSFQNIPNQQPINIYNNTNGSNLLFEARILNENDNVDEIIVQRKTAFICPKNGYLKIKELNGDITEYILTKAKTPEELRIEELERKLEEYEYKFNSTNNEITQYGAVNIANDDTSTKTTSRGVSKKS